MSWTTVLKAATYVSYKGSSWVYGRAIAWQRGNLKWWRRYFICPLEASSGSESPLFFLTRTLSALSFQCSRNKSYRYILILYEQSASRYSSLNIPLTYTGSHLHWQVERALMKIITWLFMVLILTSYCRRLVSFLMVWEDRLSENERKLLMHKHECEVCRFPQGEAHPHR